MTVEFLNSSTGITLAWLWDFGDGYTSNLENPMHIYASDGIYTVTLSTWGEGGYFSQKSKDIAINTVTDIVLEYV